MAQKTKKPRNRAAQDATLINVRALKKDVAELKRQDRQKDRTIRRLFSRLEALELKAK